MDEKKLQALEDLVEISRKMDLMSRRVLRIAESLGYHSPKDEICFDPCDCCLNFVEFGHDWCVEHCVDTDKFRGRKLPTISRQVGGNILNFT